MVSVMRRKRPALSGMSTPSAPAGPSGGPSPKMAGLSAVLFDLDGTLYDKRLLEPAVALGTPRNMALFAAIASARRAKAGSDMGTRAALLDALALDASLRLGGKMSPAEVRTFYEEVLYSRFIAVLSRFYRLRPCLAALFGASRSAAGKGLPFGILSDYGRVDERLSAIGLDPSLFAARLSSEDEGALKPSPRPFLAAAARMDAEPSGVLVVGDRPDTDGAGAAAAGMRYFRLRGRRDARRLVRALRELTET